MIRPVALLMFSALLSLFSYAQEVLHAVWILNEGYAEDGEIVEPVELGRFDPATSTYEVWATVEGASYASDLVVSDGSVYVAAQGQILHYDANNGDLLNSIDFQGARKLALHGDRLYATRGDFDQSTWQPIAFDSYLDWFDATTLEWEGALTVAQGPALSTEGIVVLDQAIYVAINNGFDWGQEVGLIGKFDPLTNVYSEVDLGPSGKNPVHLLELDGALLTVNNGDWSATTVSRFEPENETITTVSAASSAAGCNAACVAGAELLFQVSGEFAVRSMEPVSLTEQSPWLNTGMSFYAMAEDPTTGNVYASETDWFSYGMIHVFHADGTEQFAFDCGVSPGAIAMEVREVNAIGSIATHAHDPKAVGTYDVMGRLMPHQSMGSLQWTIEVLPDGRSIKRIQAQ